MSNNNYLSPTYSALDNLDHCNSEAFLVDCSHLPSFKENDIFLKSQVSLADTACEDHSPILHKF